MNSCTYIHKRHFGGLILLISMMMVSRIYSCQEGYFKAERFVKSTSSSMMKGAHSKRGTSEVISGDIPKVMEPREIVLDDFNGDDRVDIFIADQGKDADPWPGYQNTLILSAPGGKMVDASKNLPQQSDQTHSATTADIDGDGDNDLFIGNLGGGGVAPQIWLNDGTGIFTIANGILPNEQTDLMKNWYTTCLFSDINNDEYPDLILGQGDINRESHVLINDGTGHFTRVETSLPPSFFAPEQCPVDIKAGDIDEDDLMDLLIVNTRNSFYGWYIQVLINNGDGTFRDETAFSSTSVRQLFALDVAG